MDLAALLARPPFSQLDETLKDYAREALGETCSHEDAVELLAPYLLDADLVADEAEVQRLVGCKVAAGGGAAAEEGPSIMAAPLSIGAATAEVEEEPAQPAAAASAPAAARAAAGAQGSRVSAARQAAQAAEAVKAALAPGASLELALGGGAEGEAATAVARVLRAELPSEPLGASDGQQQADFLAAALVAYGEERTPELLRDWSELLREVLEDSSVTVEGEELADVARRLVEKLIRKGLLKAKPREAAVGEVLLATLPEDEAWHEAVVESIAQDGRLNIVFLEYGRPLQLQPAEVRFLDDVADDEDGGELKEGDCEMCQRTMFLTFHHLIPKDKHPTYLGKRLPRGIEGEPTRGFLNSYGLMICRQCHNMVHRIANNETLAVEFNTLAKIMEHAAIQRWVDFAKRQRTTRRAH